ncbi:MAG TPA: hypothetical protein DC038_03395 [Clostridiales bacterium]|nr:hypothetical protein [Clostridiales bacterium]
MRITTSMMTKKYVRNLNKATVSLDKIREQVETGRKYFKGSEDPVSAIKAYKLRREYRTAEMYERNIQDVDSIYTTAETNLTQIHDSMEKVYNSYLKGITGTMGAEEREIIAKELENLQKTILTALNGKFEDRYVFGGTSKDQIPFTVDTDGDLCFKGLKLNDPANKTEFDKLVNENIDVDLGLGLKFDGSGNLISDTVFNVSMSGLKFMGYGEDGSGMPNDLYSLIGEMKEQFRDPGYSLDNMTPYIGKFEEQKKQVLVNLTDIGAKTNYLDFLKVRNDDSLFNLNEKLVEVELADPTEAITEFMMQRYSYNAALSMGNKILENSFIDFMK